MAEENVSSQFPLYTMWMAFVSGKISSEKDVEIKVQMLPNSPGLNICRIKQSQSSSLIHSKI
jgi:hypothetical protein